jgi:hypothetical protein
MPRSRPRPAPPPRTAAGSTRVRDYLLAIGGSLLGVAIVAVLRFGVFDGSGTGPAPPRPGAEPAPAEDRDPAGEAPVAPSEPPDERVEAADELPAAAPRAPSVGPGRRWLTAAAMREPLVTGMAPTEPGYSPVLEAHQRFHELERDWRARRQTGLPAWQAFQAEQTERHRALARRARELERLGEPELARRLKAEFTRLRAALAREAARPDGGDHLPQR